MNDMPDDTPLVLTAAVDRADRDRFKARVEQENTDGFRAYVRFFSDPKYVGLTPETLRNIFARDEHLLILAADDMTFEHPLMPVLCIDPEGRSASFRAALEHLWIVENNLSIANLLFEEMAEDQVEDGWLVPA